MLSRIFLSKSVHFLLFFGLLFFACSKETPDPTIGCSSDNECKNSARCGASSKKCIPIICGEDKDCRGGWYCNLETERCQEQAYTKPECTKDSDCSQGEKCQSKKCVKTGCSTDKDCPQDKPTCKNRKCIKEDQPECTTNTDCKDPSKPICKENKCIEKEQSECTTNTDCLDPTKPECHDGKCTEAQAECTTNDDCKDPAKPLCAARQCVPDNGAKEGEPCEDGVIDCKSKLICNKKVGKTTGICRIPCLVYTPHCESPKVCQQVNGNQGICMSPNNGKSEGDDCTNDACELNFSCVTWKNKKVCSIPCDPNNTQCSVKQECLEVEKGKKEYFCVEERDPCGAGRPCTSPDDICENGKCNPKAGCNPPCPTAQTCDNGKCRNKLCPNEIKCTSPEVCKSGICQTPIVDPPCVPCSSSGKCPNLSDMCLGGLAGVSTRYCFGDCSNGKTCADTKNFSCKAMTITYSKTCSSNTDCSTISKAVCNNGKCTRANIMLCIPIIGSCKNKCKSITCPTGQICISKSGSCVTANKGICSTCTYNEECGGKNDICLSANGKKYCGIDCSKGQQCPSGYQCATLNGGAKQCAPPPPNYSCP